MKIGGLDVTMARPSCLLGPYILYSFLQLLASGETSHNSKTLGNLTTNLESENRTEYFENVQVAPSDHNVTWLTTVHGNYTLDNVTEWPEANYTKEQWNPSDLTPNISSHSPLHFSQATVNTTGETSDYLKSSSSESVTSGAWLTGPSGGLNSVASGVANPRQATSESASSGARLNASVDNATQFLPTTELQPPPGPDNLPHAPVGHGLGHKPINYPALHVYRRLKETSDSSGAEIIAIFGLILCILFIICIFTVDLSTVRRDIKRIRYRRLGRSIHLDNMESVEVTEGWQRL